jgi:hypothetical protein
MIKYFAPLLLLVSTSAYAQTNATVSVGGMKTDHGGATLTFDGELSHQHGKWQGVYDIDTAYQEAKHTTTMNMEAVEAKENYAIDDRNYAIVGNARYDFNQFRPWKRTEVVAAGWGYKLVRTDNLKVSNELTTGVRLAAGEKYAVFRNSLWIRYSKGPLTALNKFLYERSNINYYRNQTVASYALTPVLTAGVQNMYTRDVKENNVTSFTLGAKF